MEFKICHRELEPGTGASLRFRLTTLAVAVLLVVGFTGCGKSPEQQKAEAAAHLAATTGRLRVSSNRANATIEATLIPAAGEVAPATVTGTVGQLLSNLPPGKYTVTARSDGWPDMHHEVNLAAGGITEVESNFQGGSLKLDSLPSNLTVKYGKAILGKTPLVVPELPPGEVTLNLEAPLWPPMDFTTTITAKEETTATARLPHGKLTIDSGPPGATIVFADHVIGQTPRTFEAFQAGTNKLTLQSKGFPPLEVTFTMEDHGEVSLRPLLAEGFPELNPEGLLRAVWVDTKSLNPDRLSPGFSQAIDFRPRNGVVKNLDRVKLFEKWLDKTYRFTGLVKSYNRETGQIEYAEEECELTKYRILATLSPAARADKDLVAQLVKGSVFVLYGRLSAVEEPRWPVKSISLEFGLAEPLR